MKWDAKLITHLGEKRIAVFVEREGVLVIRVRSMPGARWSHSRKVWHVPDTDENRREFGLPLSASLLPNEEGMRRLDAFKSWMRSRRYSENTVKTYMDAMKSFLVFY